MRLREAGSGRKQSPVPLDAFLVFRANVIGWERRRFGHKPPFCLFTRFREKLLRPNPHRLCGRLEQRHGDFETPLFPNR